MQPIMGAMCCYPLECAATKIVQLNPASGSTCSEDLVHNELEIVESRAPVPFTVLDAAAPPSLEVPEVPVRTVGEEDPTIAARHVAYLLRKERIQARRLRNSGGKEAGPLREDFLSSLTEVEADVRYRFTFAVVGEEADRLSSAVCDSRAASRLQSTSSRFCEDSPLPEEDRGESPTNSVKRTASLGSAPPRAKSYRCLGPVTTDGEQPQLAKLVFTPQLINEDVPVCQSWQEASSSVVVFILTVDGPLSGAGGFEEQLLDLAAAVERIRGRGKAKHRPVRAVILCQAQADTGAGEPWAATLSEFENKHGELWKFGPLALQDGDALHATFSEIVSWRIDKSRTERAGLGPKEPEEMEQDGEEVVVISQRSEEEDVRVSRVNSTKSEGYHRPPVFEAECDGSECGDAALELHARYFGVRPGEGPGTPPMTPLASQRLSDAGYSRGVSP